MRKARSKKRGCHISPPGAAVLVNASHRTLLHALNDLRDCRRVARRDDAMPVVGEENPGRQIERVPRAGTVESAGQQPEASLNQLCTPRKQAPGDEEIPVRQKWTPQLRHGRRIPNRGADGHRKERTAKAAVRATCFGGSPQGADMKDDVGATRRQQELRENMTML